MVSPHDETVYDLTEDLDGTQAMRRPERIERRPVLMAMTGFEAGRAYPLNEQRTVLGRAEECQINILEAGVSRRHALFDVVDNIVEVIDLKSRNGVYVNGQKVQRAILADQDKVGIGKKVVLKLSFVSDEEHTFNQKLFEAAVHDPLTKLYNKRYFLGALERSFAVAQGSSIELSMLMLDLDHFKRLNDTYGHLAGDLALRHVAALITSEVRGQDIACRYGGEEFVVLLHDVDRTEAARIAERMRSAIEGRPLQAEGTIIPLSTSIGVASAQEASGDGPESLVGLADSRLYEAKRAGRNRVCATGPAAAGGSG